MVNEWITAIIVFCTIGIIGYTTKKVRDMVTTHRQQHEIINTLTSFVEQHRQDHVFINEQLGVITKANMSQLKDRILQKYKYVTEEGVISIYDLEVFKSLCTSYYESGGNSFIEKLEEEIMTLPREV